MQTTKANTMSQEVIDSIIRSFGKAATDFLIEDINEDPNCRSFTILFRAYEFFWVGINYEKGLITPYIAEKPYMVKIKRLVTWWEDLDLDKWTKELAAELKLRIPDKFLTKKGWV